MLEAGGHVAGYRSAWHPTAAARCGRSDRLPTFRLMRSIPAFALLLAVPTLAVAAVRRAQQPRVTTDAELAHSVSGAMLPELPRPFGRPTTHPVRRTVPIAAGDTAALRRALATARSGDEIVLAFGTYAGWWELGAHAGDGWVTVRSADTLDTSGTRRARLLSPGKNRPALRVSPGAHRWRLLNVEFGALPAVRELNTLVFLGAADGHTKLTDDHPSDLVFDRVRIAAHGSLDLRRCLLGNADRWALQRSDLVCHGSSADAAAISAWTAARGVLIEGNRIAGSGHGILFGGSDAADSTLLPRDIVVRGNRIYKPTSWKGRYRAKTLVEFKVGRRVLLEGNVLEHHWADAQTGFALLLKSVNQDGTAPWSVVEDVTVRHNILRHSAAGINLAARPETHPAVPMARVEIVGNLLYGIGGENGRMVQIGGDVQDVAIAGNTLLHSGYANSALTVERGARPARLLVVQGNLMTAGEYGWHSPAGSGAAALTHLAGTAWRADRNALIGASANSKLPPGTRGAASLAEVGFLDPSGADPSGFALRPTSAYRGLGAPIDAVLAATAGARALQ